MRGTVLEICAGGGGQALGLEEAGFQHSAALEIDPQACSTLRLNRPHWRVIEADVREFSGRDFSGVDLLAAGVPCPPFSVAGKQLGSNDERDLFPDALRIAGAAQPRGILLENVPGFASEKFRRYRSALIAKFRRLGYAVQWNILNACDFGVPQLRPRFIMVALREEDEPFFAWPKRIDNQLTVGYAIGDLMASGGWKGAAHWITRANSIAPTIVGGSKKHGGPDLGPTRARQQWSQLGVDGIGIADEPPHRDFSADGTPKLTVRMVARLQGFPDDWTFAGRKTAAYRQVGNAFPPPVAAAVGGAILSAFNRVAPSLCDREQLQIFDRPIETATV